MLTLNTYWYYRGEEMQAALIAHVIMINNLLQNILTFLVWGTCNVIELKAANIFSYLFIFLL